MEGSLTWSHPRDALLLLHLLLLEQVLEEGDLGLKHVHFIDRLLLECVKHLDLSIERLGYSDVPF